VGVELQKGATGEPIPGFTLAETNCIKGNFIARPASWGDPNITQVAFHRFVTTNPNNFSRSLNQLAGQKIKIKLVLPAAQLFSLAFVCV